jgi:MFS family permease
MVGLPILAKIVNDRGVNPLKRDLNFARLSILAMGLGNFFIFAADTQWVFIMGTISMSLGIGYTSQIRALITAVVEPHLLATVNTTLSTVETLLSLLSMPIIGWLFATGIDMGGAWRGLPYLVLSSLCLGVAALLVLYRIPPVKESHLA